LKCEASVARMKLSDKNITAPKIIFLLAELVISKKRTKEK
jgi:hypothetical protein